MRETGNENLIDPSREYSMASLESLPIVSDYAKRLKETIAAHLLPLYKEHPDKVKPVTITVRSTSSGAKESVHLITLEADYPQQGRHQYIFALDGQGRIIGDVTTYFTTTDKDKLPQPYILAQRMVSTGIRGRGLATPLDDEAADQRQRMADAEGLPVVYELIDSNLELIEQRLKQAETEADRLKLIEERRRWERLYGDPSSKGFTLAPDGTVIQITRPSAEGLGHLLNNQASVDNLQSLFESLSKQTAT